MVLLDVETPRAAQWRRGEGGWSFEDLAGLDAVLQLSAMPVQLTLAEIYEDVTFEA